MAKISDENLIWIDLEMTGLDPHSDLIIEIATIITDKNLDCLWTIRFNIHLNDRNFCIIHIFKCNPHAMPSKDTSWGISGGAPVSASPCSPTTRWRWSPKGHQSSPI